MSKNLINAPAEPAALGVAFIKGKDAKSEEAQEHANNGSLALYA